MRWELTILMFQEVWSDDSLVHDNAAVVLDWSHTPDEEDALKKPVEGNHFCNVEREELKNWEGRKDHPVSQPFRVIAFVVWFDGLHRDVSWIGDSNDVAENFSGITESEVQGDEANNTWKKRNKNG